MHETFCLSAMFLMLAIAGGDREDHQAQMPCGGGSKLVAAVDAPDPNRDQSFDNKSGVGQASAGNPSRSCSF